MKPESRSSRHRPLPESALSRRLYFWARAWAWDVSSRVEWLSDLQPYYEKTDVVDAYDSVAWVSGTTQTLSSLREPTSAELLALVQERGCRSVLDIGCGAGVFYHLLRSTLETFEYRGIDASAAQVARAVENFGPVFEVGDVAVLDRKYLARYDAIHAYSVFPFMTVKDQIGTLDRILGSGALTVLEVSATKPDVGFAPSSCFKNFGKYREGEQKLLTAVSFPFAKEVEAVVSRYSDRFQIAWTVRDYPNSQLLNGSRRSGGALSSKDTKKSKRRKLLSIPFEKKVKIMSGVIRPVGWSPPENLDDVVATLKKGG